MPSAVFHAAVGILIGLAILGDKMDTRALVVITIATLFPDIDSVLSIWFPGAHRTYLHNVFVVLIPGAALLSLHGSGHMQRLKGRWPDAEQVLWVALITFAVAGIGLDAVASGTNLLYPIQDQYYQIHGNIRYSSQSGLEQTITDVDRAKVGTTQDMYYGSGIDPVPGPDPQDVDRTFPIFENTLQLLLSMTVFSIIGYRSMASRKIVSRRKKRMVLPYTVVQSD